MNRKIVSISPKRQITIPMQFFKSLGFADEAEIIEQNGALIIRPAARNHGGEFAEQILADLVAEGYSGESLIDEFRARQAKVRFAVEHLIEAADAAARGEGEYYSFDDVFTDLGSTEDAES